MDAVKKANSLSLAMFEQCYLEDTSLMHIVHKDESKATFDISHHDTASLAREDFEACFDLIKTTSMSDYKASSMDWKPDHKKREMKDPLMHYLLVRRQSSPSDLKEPTATPEIEGFLSFMLTYDSHPCVPVLYVYEIHLAESARGTGLGARLLSICETLAQKVAVSKVMLTCFLSNNNARQFYDYHGYTRDPVSPEDRRTRNTTVKADYIIMSKDVVSDSAPEQI
ncbi:hypothetical protein AMS68_003601 [Peltaster fructicola]|uniref:N-alpha-acetyltransferase 40 n=1 Tax=Peltaster fructicola TaxID=286661 RepID=A0A6H0XTM6_9PEZI|nr:hypothetical protein AMS68_003601 [Peltaster fructicola]